MGSVYRPHFVSNSNTILKKFAFDFFEDFGERENILIPKMDIFDKFL